MPAAAAAFAEVRTNLATARLPAEGCRPLGAPLGTPEGVSCLLAGAVPELAGFAQREAVTVQAAGLAGRLAGGTDGLEVLGGLHVDHVRSDDGVQAGALKAGNQRTRQNNTEHAPPVEDSPSCSFQRRYGTLPPSRNCCRGRWGSSPSTTGPTASRQYAVPTYAAPTLRTGSTGRTAPPRITCTRSTSSGWAGQRPTRSGSRSGRRRRAT